MKIDQVAYYCTDDHAVKDLKDNLGLKKSAWVTDTVTGMSKVVLPNGTITSGENVAELQFNYSLGIELEILRYISGPHWHALYMPRLFISHIGVHLEDGEAFPSMQHSRIVQETRTLKHTSEYLTDPSSPGFGRTYQYRIYEMGPHNYIKFIRRVHNERLQKSDRGNDSSVAHGTEHVYGARSHLP
jgi:hypothetical protein